MKIIRYQDTAGNIGYAALQDDGSALKGSMHRSHSVSPWSSQ